MTYQCRSCWGPPQAPAWGALVGSTPWQQQRSCQTSCGNSSSVDAGWVAATSGLGVAAQQGLSSYLHGWRRYCLLAAWKKRRLAVPTPLTLSCNRALHHAVGALRNGKHTPRITHVGSTIHPLLTHRHLQLFCPVLCSPSTAILCSKLYAFWPFRTLTFQSYCVHEQVLKHVCGREQV